MAITTFCFPPFFTGTGSMEKLIFQIFHFIDTKLAAESPIPETNQVAEQNKQMILRAVFISGKRDNEKTMMIKLSRLKSEANIIKI